MSRTVQEYREAGVCPPESPQAAQILDAIIASAAFRRAPALRRLLLYLWEHRAEQSGEYAIALDVLSKRPDFDSKLDATVRVQVSRLRQKLKEFFNAEGSGLAFRLVIPAGGHALELQPVQISTASAPASPAHPSPLRQSAFLAAIAACILLCAATAWFWHRARSLEAEAAARPASAELPPFWRSVLGNGRVTHVVFPTPTFFQVGRLRVRDVAINDPAGISMSPQLESLLRPFGKPSVSQTYSVTSDTLALAILLKALANRGVPVTISSTRDLSLELFGSENLLFLGVPPTSRLVERLLARTDFYLQPGGSVVGIRHPLSNEPKQFAPSVQSSTGTTFGIIAVLPGQAPQTRLVLLCGLQTFALASYLASPLTLHELGDFLARKGHPEFFEMVVSSEVEGF
ncbi:MAG: helix-turn-helix domain-containing protein, partial [Bryobacteraceae bacterium]